MIDANEYWEKEMQGELAKFMLGTKMEDDNRARQQETTQTMYT